MKHIILIAFCFTFVASSAQPSQCNLDKYWSYRNRLKTYFMKIGALPGESKGMSARSIGFAYCDVRGADWPKSLELSEAQLVYAMLAIW